MGALSWGVYSREVPGLGEVPGPGGLFLGGVPGPGMPGRDTPPGTATAAGGTHPTGMHSCWQILVKIHKGHDEWMLIMQKFQG